MKNRILLLIVSCVLALRANAAMVRVTSIENGRTLIVERDAHAERVTLAGIEIVDENSARTLLEWTLLSKWILVEHAPGGALVYRSPDALFINRELVLRGYARATLPHIEPESQPAVTFLGTLNLPAPSRASNAQTRRSARAKTGSAAGSGSALPRPRRSAPRASPRPRK
jgi:hypothetical protein